MAERLALQAVLGLEGRAGRINPADPLSFLFKRIADIGLAGPGQLAVNSGQYAQKDHHKDRIQQS